MTPNPLEADDYAWRTLEDVRRDIDAAPQNYSVWFREYIAAKWPTVMTAALTYDMANDVLVQQGGDWSQPRWFVFRYQP